MTPKAKEPDSVYALGLLLRHRPYVSPDTLTRRFQSVDLAGQGCHGTGELLDCLT